MWVVMNRGRLPPKPFPRGEGGPRRGSEEECGRKSESQHNESDLHKGRVQEEMPEQVLTLIIIAGCRPHSSSVTNRFRRADWRQLLPGRSDFGASAPVLQKEKRLCPLFLRDKGANPLRYHSCSGICIPALASLYRANPACPTEIQTAARRGYPIRSHYCLAPYRQLSGMWGRTDLSSS